MEKIKINDMQTKGVVFIVKYTNPDHSIGGIKEATLNVNFNKQEIWYLENEVGIGGTVDVVITNKEKVEGNPSAGFWVNITNVDMTSAVKGGVEVKFVPESPANVPQTGLMSVKDISIVSQVLLKAAFYAKGGTPQEVLDAYRFFVLELEQNG